MYEPTEEQMQQEYLIIAKKVHQVLQDSGVESVARGFATAMQDPTLTPIRMHMMATACIRAEDLPFPSVVYLKGLMHHVGLMTSDMTPARREVYKDMLIYISGQLCQELIMKSMGAAKAVANSLGATIDISAASQAPEESSWSPIEAAEVIPHVLH